MGDLLNKKTGSRSVSTYDAFQSVKYHLRSRGTSAVRYFAECPLENMFPTMRLARSTYFHELKKSRPQRNVNGWCKQNKILRELLSKKPWREGVATGKRWWSYDKIWTSRTDIQKRRSASNPKIEAFISCSSKNRRAVFPWCATFWIRNFFWISSLCCRTIVCFSRPRAFYLQIFHLYNELLRFGFYHCFSCSYLFILLNEHMNCRCVIMRFSILFFFCIFLFYQSSGSYKYRLTI